MHLKKRQAFTMLELTFVTVIIGILSAIAIPRFAATRDDATITKARSTVAAVRNSISTERQKRILRGDFTPIGDLALTNGANQPIFDFYDGDNTLPVLEYGLRSCLDASARGCWISTADATYVYRMPASTNNVIFTLGNNRFTCVTTGASGPDCRNLTE